MKFPSIKQFSFISPEVLMAKLSQTRTYYQEILRRSSSSSPDDGQKRRKQVHFSLYQLPWLLYSLYEVFRENMTSYALKSGDGRFFKFDLVAAEFTYMTKFDAYIFICFGSLAMFYIYLLYSLYYTNMLDGRIMVSLGEIVVGTWQQFWQLNPQLKFCLTWNPLRNFRQIQKIFKSFKNREVKLGSKCSGSKLKFLSDKNRMQILEIQFSNEIAQTGIVVVSVIFLLIGIVTYSIKAYSHYDSIRFTLFVAHLFVQGYLVLDEVKCGFFVVFTLKTISYVYNRLFGQCYNRIYKLRNNRRKRSDRFADSKDTFYRLHQIRVYHNELVQFIVYFNGRFISKIMFVFLLTNLPPNIYMITYTSLHPLDFVNQLFISTMVALQFIAILLFIIPMVQLNSSIYAFDKLLVPLQFEQRVYRSVPMVRQKIKLLHFYEQSTLNSGSGFTVGPLALVTETALYQFLLAYTSYILFAITLLTNEQN